MWARQSPGCHLWDPDGQGSDPLLILLQDVDECETAVCPGENEKCENTEGSYRCICAEGYKQIEGICVKEQIPGEPQEEGRGGEALLRWHGDLTPPLIS